MYEHDIRWGALLPVSILLGMAALYAETSGWWFSLPIRPDWFWCLAVFACLKAPPTPSLLAMAWCGLARDVLLGPRPGAATLAYVLTGLFIVNWKPAAEVRGWPGHLALATMGALAAGAIKHALDYGQAMYMLWDRIAVLALGDAVLTLVAYLPLAAVLSLPSFRPWQKRAVFRY